MGSLVKQDHGAMMERLANILKSHDKLEETAEEEQSVAVQEVAKIRELVIILLAHTQSPVASEMGLHKRVVKARVSDRSGVRKTEIWTTGEGIFSSFLGWTEDGEPLHWTIEAGVFGKREMWAPVNESVLGKDSGRSKGPMYIRVLQEAINECDGYLAKRKNEVVYRKNLLARY